MSNDSEDNRRMLPSTIVGALPSPQRVMQDHRIIHSHFTPDGNIYNCCCGWVSGLCPTEEDFQLAWMEHL